MTTTINSRPYTAPVDISPTATRVTPQPTHPFNAVLRAGASDVLHGAQSAASALPGGAVLAAAIRGTSGTTGTAVDGLAPGGTSASANPSLQGGGGTSSNNLEGALAKQAEDNMYYLGLQQRIQDENRYYTTVSNILKAEHDTAKNSIGNLR